MEPHLHIILDNESAVYFPGQTVTGRVKFDLEYKTQLRGITMDAKGGARVHWTETRIQTTGQGKLRNKFRRGQAETIDYTAEDGYFRERITILQHGGEIFDLAAGNYQYPFSFKLPGELPSSFEGKYGYVRYSIKSTVDLPGQDDVETKMAFTVNSLVDLNTISLANEPTRGTDSTTICCWCCRSAPITVNFSIDKMGYVPGQYVAFTADVENLSGRTMLGSKVQLVQYTKYSATGKTRIVERVLAEKQRGPFDQYETWQRASILIPPVVISNLPHCDIISVDYRLEFTVRVGKFSSDLKVPLNIIIGNIPLCCSFSFLTAPTENVLTNLPAGLFSRSGFFSKTGKYPDLPPPGYKEGTFKGFLREEGDSDNLNGGLPPTFAPRYLFYQSK